MRESYDHFAGLYDHDPQGCFIARLEGQPAGICIATPYRHSGFIGELVVRPEMRRHGIGAALLDRAVSYLRRRELSTVYLDGVAAAVLLYERHGFRQICRSLRFYGRIPGRRHPQVRPVRAGDLPEIYSLDRGAFGDDRSYFLERRWRLFPQLFKALLVDGSLCGYITARRVEGFVFAGPWVVAPGVGDALPLLEDLACEAMDATIAGATFAMGILESNSQAVELVRASGMIERDDIVWRMALGAEDDLGKSSQCLAVGTAGKG